MVEMEVREESHRTRSEGAGTGIKQADNKNNGCAGQRRKSVPVVTGEACLLSNPVTAGRSPKREQA